MTTLTIEQGNNIEIVSNAVIQKLYETVLDSTNVTLSGNLQCEHCYEDAYNYLTGYITEGVKRFPNLAINVTGSIYIRFADPALEQPFATKWGDGIGVTATLLSLANATATEINTMLMDLPDNTLTDMRDFKCVTCSSNNSNFFGQTSGITNKLQNVVHAYIPSCYSAIRTGQYYSPFGSALTDIEMHNNITYLGSYAFANCSNLIMSELPDSITYIGSYAFSGCSKVTINNSKNVTEMYSAAFKQCTSITSFTVKNICKMVGGSFFNGCTNLETVTFEQGSGPDIEFISEGSWGSGVFVNTKITTLDLPERIVGFGSASMNCSTLRTLIIRKTTVPSKGLWSLNNNVLIYVPNESVQLYKDTWTDIADRIHSINDLPLS